MARIALPPGFRAAVYAWPVPGARSLALGPGGTVFVGSRGEGRVYALHDADGDGRAERVEVLLAGLDTPNGVAVGGDDLYVAENHRLVRYAGLAARPGTPPRPEVLARLPRYRHHGWRYLRIGPQGRPWLSLGAPCNVCEAPGTARIVRVEPDGRLTPWALGVRNSVGFDWHPRTGVLWFTDNGRDWLGDDLPPDELNRAPRPGLHFGFPYCHGRGLADPEFGRGADCRRYTPPALELGPHVAALGMRFYTGDTFPPPWRGRLFIAEHGSWNRSERIGYRITTVRVEGGRADDYRPFAVGWLTAGRVWGRPVDLLVMPDGALLVSDDHAGAVYRIAYEGADAAPQARSNRAMDSTCAVCGNMSMTPAAARR
ncbi:glucose/arabinose dehydrogenase [Inmirania thermothiophila]|uniref:Glucose/arabinose dehydrogenase n=1 Tax=Inmirania thermothiophila TaxID=1750597 RepID=A0A3N1Y3J6_9GAMM|nr:glucose/arabinose dehydrogenase [Inmirania thermothiophila]